MRSIEWRYFNDNVVTEYTVSTVMFTYRAATLASPQRQCCRSRIWFDL